MHWLACEDMVIELFGREGFILSAITAMGCFVAIVSIVAGAVGGILKTRARENSRRELAAYVAEGSIQAEEAVAILNAGSDAGRSRRI